MSSTKMATLAATAALLAGVAVARGAAADEPPTPDTPPRAASGFAPHFVGDLRALFLVRTDNNYFGHANTYSYPIDPAAAGVQMNLGVELVPRLTLVASGDYAIDGADRDSARLRLQSGALVGLLRWSFFRAGEDPVHFEAALQGGVGRYVIKETYLDPALSPQTFESDDGSWGGTAGLQASMTLAALVMVVGYGFHYAPATIADRIGGTVQAGGHEISLGLGVRL